MGDVAGISWRNPHFEFKMKKKYFSLLFFMGLLAGIGFVEGLERQYFWIGLVFFQFLGTFFFDDKRLAAEKWINVIFIGAIFGFTVLALVATSIEGFWHQTAAAVFTIFLGFEFNSSTARQQSGVRSTGIPAVLFFSLIMFQNLSILTPAQNLTFALLALLGLALFETMTVFHESKVPPYFSAIRFGVCSTLTLYYATTFLPGEFNEDFFLVGRILLPILSILLALISFFEKKTSTKFTFFCSGWSLLIFWSSLSGEPARIYGALAAAIVVPWAICICKNKMFSDNPKRRILDLSAWAMPGSLLFAIAVFNLAPSNVWDLQTGASLWILAFLFHWGALAFARGDSESKEGEEQWSWNNSASLFMNLLGGAVLAFPRGLKELLDSLGFAK